MNLKKYIREIPDWPQKGVSFRDICPLLQNAKAFREAINQLTKPYFGERIDKIVGIDARGFIFASALAYKLKTGLVPVRKRGKLPYKTVSQKYTLEYATNVLEMHKDAIKKGERVLLVDDVLATGGTMAAAIKLVEKLGGTIAGIAFLIELDNLDGRKKLKNYPIFGLIKYL